MKTNLEAVSGKQEENIGTLYLSGLISQAERWVHEYLYIYSLIFLNTLCTYKKKGKGKRKIFSRQKYQPEQKQRSEIARLLMTLQYDLTLPNSTIIFLNLCSLSSYLTSFCPTSPLVADLSKKFSPLPYWIGSQSGCKLTPLFCWFISWMYACPDPKTRGRLSRVQPQGEAPMRAPAAAAPASRRRCGTGQDLSSAGAAAALLISAARSSPDPDRQPARQGSLFPGDYCSPRFEREGLACGRDSGKKFSLCFKIVLPR